MELIIIFALVLLNGIFAMSELSLVSSRKFKLENAKKKGSAGAKKALELSENPARFLSTVQIGITLIGIVLGFYSGDALTNDFAAMISKIDILAPYAQKIAGPAIVVCITYLSIVFGELFPKQLGMTFPEKIAILIARPMNVLSKITSPFVWLLSTSNSLLSKIFGIKKDTDSKVSEEEIKSIIKESAEGGEIQDIEQNIVERVFELGDTKASHLHTHRNQIVHFDINDSREEIIAKVNSEAHSAYPVTQNNNLDNLKGIILLKDLFTLINSDDFNLETYLKEPVYVTENTSAYRILENFREKKMHYGIVVDEYGTMQGMITMDDVMDALVGDMTEVHHDEFQIIESGENMWLVDGQFPLKSFAREIGADIDEELIQNIQTVAGFIINKNNELPNEGDTIKIDNFEYKIVDKDGQRIDKILVTKI